MRESAGQGVFAGETFDTEPLRQHLVGADRRDVGIAPERGADGEQNCAVDPLV